MPGGTFPTGGPDLQFCLVAIVWQSGGLACPGLTITRDKGE